ncbi:MAG: DUF2334 domain-containing protein [Candidatus Hydrothermarchaeales archaeon]
MLILLLLSLPITTMPVQKQVWVEIHDTSPGYGTEKLEEVTKILDRHKVDRKIIFVIPNHNNATPLSEYLGFAGYLKTKEEEGYIIGAHGYTHRGFEFYTSRKKAEELIEASEAEFNTCGIKPQVFYPPRYLVSGSSLEVLKRHYDEIYMVNKVLTDGRVLPYGVHEFTWFEMDHRITLPLAKLSYLLSKQQVFRLSVHIGAVNSPENLRFLDEFLTWSGHINAG